MKLLRKLKKYAGKIKACRENTISLLARRTCYEVVGSGNVIQIAERNLSKRMRKISIFVDGDCNTIKIGENFDLKGRCIVRVIGNNNEIVIGDNVGVVNTLTIQILKSCRNGRVEVGDNTTFWKTAVQNYDNGSSVRIGSDCMFSYDTAVLNSDEHAILKDGNVINCAEHLDIGNHVWVGYGAAIMKNAKLADNCIVGRSALVAGSFLEKGDVVAGIPARVIKRGVDWSRRSVNDFAP